MSSSDALDVLLVADGAALRLLEETARRDGGRMRVRRAPVEEPISFVEEMEPQVVVFAENAPDLLKTAQRVREVAPLAQLLFLVARDRIDRFRSGLPFVPHLASAWTAEADIAPDVLARILERAGEAALQRGRAATVNSRINTQLAARAALDEHQQLRQLAISEGYLATLLSQAPVAFVACSVGGTVLAWNAAAARLFDLPTDEALGRNLRDVLPQEAAERLQPLLGAAAVAEAPPTREISFRDASGAQRWIECSLAAVRDPRGGVASVSIAIHDVTASREVEVRLRESEARFRTLTESLPQLVWTATPDGRCDYLSTQWIEYTGVPFEAQMGFAWLDAVVHPDDRDRVFEHWQGAVEGRHDYDIDYRIRRADGAYRWFKVRGTPFHDLDGRVSHWFGSCTDIQDIVEAREVLAHSAEELEARVAAEMAERSKAEEALRQAQKMEAVGQLTGGIAHDFNNLLQGIVGSLELVRKRVQQGRVGELDRLLTAAAESANRAAALTHRLLAFSRRQPLMPRAVDVNRLVTSMEPLVSRTLGEQVQLRLGLAEDLWVTLCDANQLESSLLNLAINARDAMPDGGLLVIETANVTLDAAAAALTAEASPGEYVRISVTDTGVGMAPDVRAHAFDPFFTTKPIGQGTGLGLSMVYGFARQSGGHVSLDTEVGRGTTVALHLPRHAGPAVADTPTSASRIAEAPNREVVLVVEDEAVVRALVVNVLEDLGYVPLQAVDGPEGLEILRTRSDIDLLVTDIGLPGLNGRQVADAARVTRPDLRVLYMTGYAEKATLAEGLLQAGTGLITKPFTIETLSQRIREMLEKG